MAATTTSEPGSFHVPVMVEQVVAGLNIRAGGRYLDATAGGGGHTDALLAHLDDRGRVVACDRDPEAIARLEERFRRDLRVTVYRVNFAGIGGDPIVGRFAPYDGVLFDFGVSSRQIDDPQRGFSFMHDGPLDMRMDRTQPLTAADVANDYPEAELARVLREYGEQPRARRIAAEIVRARPLATTAGLAAVIERAAAGRERTKTLARVFQALRIEVNGELDAIDRALRAAYDLLAANGRLVALSYHSLEDRRVKRFLREMAGEEEDRWLALPTTGERAVRMRALPRSAVKPGAEEIERNPRARSARLRIGEKLAR